METTTILNCTFNNITFDELIRTYKRGILIPTNVDMVMKMQKDKEFYEVYSSADYRTNDSQILYWASRLLGNPLKGTIPGSDFFPAFCDYHKENKDITIFLLGAKSGVARTALEKINAKVNRKLIVDEYSPSFGFEKNEQECHLIIDKIKKSRATVLAIGLGAPKQEKWVMKYKHLLPDVQMFICIGATIDFEAGNISRAPRIFRRCNLEWLYRLCKEPKRLWRRYIIDDLPFIFLIFKQMLGLYKNPFEKVAKNDYKI